MIRTIQLSDLGDALRLGWEDFKAVPSHAIILCVIYPVLGLVLARLALGYSVLPLLFPLAAGFALLGPFAALGLYELSYRRERGEEASAWHATEVLRSPSFGAMLGLGTLLLALFVIWVATAQAIYVATFGYEAAAGIPDFAKRVLTTSQGWWLIVVGCGVGFLFALVALCISVVSFPLMLDRHAGAADAMLTSLQAVARNPVPMAAWGLIVAVLLVIGSLPFFLGLAIVIPLLGHATWHLYRKVIEPVAVSHAPPPLVKVQRYAADFPPRCFSGAARIVDRRIATSSSRQRLRRCTRMTAVHAGPKPCFGRGWPRHFGCRATFSSAKRFRGGHMMNFRPFFSSFAAIALVIATVSAANAAACGGSFEAWLAEFKTEAAAKGISQGAITAGLSGVTPDQSVLSRDRSQKVFSRVLRNFPAA